MKELFIVILTIYSLSNYGQNCNENALITQQIRASQTDGNISWELQKHYTFYNPTCTPNDKLLIHLVGSYANPNGTLLFPTLAANNGYHVISLKYPNNVAARTACEASTDVNCYLHFRKEILEGIDYSAEVSVDLTNSVYNRAIKLLQYLHANNPNQGWNEFYSGNEITWNKVVVSGHSQGGGHAAVIGIDKPVQRIIMFASPNDYSTYYNQPALWTNSSTVAEDSIYYGLNNLNDGVVNFSEQLEIWDNLGMNSFGDTVNVLTINPPYSNTHQLYTTYDTTGIGGNHSVMILDSKTPLNNNGSPVFKEAWKYLLGIESPIISHIENKDGAPLIHLFPIPTLNTINIKSNLKFNKVIITDIQGNKVQQFDFKKNLNFIKLDLATLSNGIYLIQIFDNESLIETKKITKN